MMFLMAGCIYDWVAVEEVPEIPTDKEISFSSEILPIFNSGNNCTSCHKAGATPPDLTAASAYSQITSKYLNASAPEESAIYKVPAPGSASHSNRKTYTAQQAALVLAWIKQGAKNN